MGNSKKSKVQENAAQPAKVVTNYDKKMQKRKEEEKREKRRKKITRISASVVAAIAVIAIAIFSWIKYDSVNNEYIKIGDHKVNQSEYDFYYYNSVNQFVSSYSSILASMGIDTSKDFSKQEYSDGLTWGDYFDEMAVEQIKQTSALNKEASDKNFEYDVTEDYNEYSGNISSQATEGKISISQFYKQTFGKYATEKKLKPYIEEYLKAAAYYEKLTEDNAATDAEITSKYNEDKSLYDYFDYRVFTFDETNYKDYAEVQSKANEMLNSVQDEDTFIELCRQYATDENKEDYNDDSKSLKSKTRYSSIEASLKDWMKDDTRKAGDKTIIEDEENGSCYVAYFVNRYFDDSVKEEIGDTIVSTKMQDYVNNLTKDITVKDKYNNLKYLKVNK